MPGLLRLSCPTAVWQGLCVSVELDTTSPPPSLEGMGTLRSQGHLGVVGPEPCGKELRDELMALLCFCGPHLEAITDVIQWEFCKTQLEPVEERGEGGLPEGRGEGA